MMGRIGSMLLGLVGALVALFTLQNLQTVTLSFLTWSVSLPIAVLVLVLFLLGVAVGLAAGALLRRRRGRASERASTSH